MGESVGSMAEESGYVHRNPLSFSGLQTHPDGMPEVQTVYDIVKRSVRLFANRRLSGTRIRLKNGKLGPYRFKTYKQIHELSVAFGSGLRALGLSKGDKLGIYSVNREEVMVAMNAACLHGIVDVFLYDTLGEEAAKYVSNHSEITALVAAKLNMERVLKFISTTPKIRFVIQIEEFASPAEEKECRAALPAEVKLFTYKSLLELGSKNIVEDDPPSRDDLASILYTSGTTGFPKGVMLTHGNLVSAAGAALRAVPTKEDDVHISYLPMAHIYERLCGFSGLLAGGSAGFYSGDVKQLVDDIQALRPTIFVGVPRVFQKVYDRVSQQVEGSMWHRRKLFSYAFSSKLSALPKGETTPVWDYLVFSKVRQRLGGRVRLIVSGAAPLPKPLCEFLQVCLGCTVVEGYGLSETVGSGATTKSEGYNSGGNVGLPTSCCEIKLVSIPDMNYSVHDKPFPRGEICIRGPNVFQGYYKMEEKTKEAFTEDGFFRTGDVGLWQADGSLKIIDRKKNIFKLAQGEYVAAEKIENILLQSSFIAQVWVYGNGEQDHLVAIVVPDPEALAPWAKEIGLKGDIKEICQSEKTRTLLLEEILKFSKQSKLRGFEFVKKIFVEDEEFSVDNDLLTPTMKLKRPQLKNRYQTVIDNLYSSKKTSSPKAKL